jgi:hypothetical protein
MGSLLGLGGGVADIAEARRRVKSAKKQIFPLVYRESVKLSDTLLLGVKKSDMVGKRTR